MHIKRDKKETNRYYTVMEEWVGGGHVNPINHLDLLLRSTPCLKKTSRLWLAITLTHMNGFYYFLAEMLMIE